MNVMALRQAAVFMNAGSYVMRPKSSPSVLICRRSVARIVPSVIGSSYFFPVRLSVTVRVLLAIERASLSNVATARSDDRQGDDCGGLRAQSPRAKTLKGRLVLPRQIQLALRPSSL